MVSSSENALLTQVGPGTPGGALLRRYWMPIAPLAEITDANPKRRVRVLGEDLVLFRDGQGRFGLVEEQCAHRRASLYFGFVETDGLRCPYHGWKYDVTGKCIEQPFEGANKSLLAKACQKSYPVQILAGIVWTYMGPAPAPLLPRWETLVRKDGTRTVRVLALHRCNWLQAQENSCDPVHTYYLHGHMMKMQGAKDTNASYYYRPIENFEFELCREPTWTGLRKIRVFGGERPEREFGHPAVFPNILMNPQGKNLTTHFRVPIDDTHTYIIHCVFSPSEDGSEVAQADEDIPVVYEQDWLQDGGKIKLDTFPTQDQMAWETQGPIYDRSTELTGKSDRGIVMWRQLLKQQIERVQAGQEPDGIIRDPKLNGIIRFDISKGQARMARELEMAS